MIFYKTAVQRAVAPRTRCWKNRQVVSYVGWSSKVALNEDQLRKIASNTDGEYMYEATGQQMTDVYMSLSTRFVYEERETEISAILVVVTAASPLSSAMLALHRSH